MLFSPEFVCLFFNRVRRTGGQIAGDDDGDTRGQTRKCALDQQRCAGSTQFVIHHATGQQHSLAFTCFLVQRTAPFYDKRKEQNQKAARTALDILRNHFVKVGSLTFYDQPTHKWTRDMKKMPFDIVQDLLYAAADTIRYEKTVLDIKPPVYVIGDLHGNYHVCPSFF